MPDPVTTISERITELVISAQEECSNIDGISLSSFLHSLELFRDSVRENLILSLTPNNEIYATWEGVKKHCLCFKVDGTIKYFVM